VGIIRCDKHGNQGFNEVCIHIHDEYKQNIYREYFYFRLGAFLGTLVCDECWKTHNLDNFQKFSEMSADEFLDLDEGKAKPIEDKWEKVYNSIDRHVWCIECVKEVQIKQARRNNEPDPFCVFERTLTQKQKETIESLENHLIDNFKFEKSVYWESQNKDRPAVSVMAGAYSNPLTIKIYYYIDENEQNKIVDFVAGFLQNIEFNQARLEFWEAESWIATENQFGLYGYHRGGEKLLREVYLNC
jgi:hypothetical protein